MSSSPKYTRARLSAAINGFLRQQRAAAAAAERAFRKAEEERRRAERVAQARSDVATSLDLLQQEGSRFSGTSQASNVASDLGIFLSEVRSARTALVAASTLAEVQQSRRCIRRLQNRLQELGLAAQRAAGQAQAESALAVLRQRLASIDHARAQRFAPGLLTEVERTATEAETALSKNASKKCLHLLQQAHARLDGHLQTIQARLDAWSEERDRNQVVLVEAMDRIGALAADPIVSRWMAAEIRELEQEIAGAKRGFDAEQFAVAGEVGRSVIQKVEEVINRAQERQLQDDRRSYVVRGIVEAMTRLGFVVQNGFPRLEHPADALSATIIQSRRIGGGAVAVSVPQEGDIWYDVADFPMHQQAAPNGQVIRSCDQAESQIERLHSILEGTFGIQMDELRWEGKNPQKVSRQADRLPDSAKAPSAVRDGST